MNKEPDGLESCETSPKSKSLKSYDGPVQVEILTGKAVREYKERTGRSNSALVISAKLVRRGTK